MTKRNNKFDWKDSVSLKEHFDEQLCDLEEKMELQFKLNQIAIDKAEMATNIRLEGMNEFRDSLRDQATTFLTKNEYQSRHQNLSDKIDALQKITYMGLGALVVIEFALNYFVK